MPTKEKIILLDLGGVVFQASGFSNAQIQWPIILELNAIYGHDLNLGKDKYPTFLKDYNQRTAQQLSGTQFLDLIWETLAFNSELVELVSNYGQIVIVSDNYRENITYISKKFSFDQWSIQQIYSFDYQLEKANPLFFERLLKETGFDPNQLIFIDDSPHKLVSAKQHGIKGILFQNNAQVRADLEKISG